MHAIADCHKDNGWVLRTEIYDELFDNYSTHDINEVLLKYFDLQMKAGGVFM